MPDPTAGTTDKIIFEVSTSHPDSRAGAMTTDVTVMTKADADTLYLLTSESDGISVNKSGRRSRGNVVSSEGDLSSFALYATIDGVTPGDYIFNEPVSKTGDYWMPDKEYLWPGKESLHINAYAPYCATAADEGVTSLPTAGDSPLTLTYVTPDDVTAQSDLLVAQPVDASASPCALVFDHALTAIRFVTGDKMEPCTVSDITISGVMSTGTLNLDTQAWSDVSTPQSFSVAPDTELKASADGTVASGTAITSDEQTFLLLPQTLSEDATVSLTVNVDGTPTVYTASIAGQIWTAGKTITYHLSATASSGLVLKVLDDAGNSVTTLKTPYTGGVHNFTVQSYMFDGSGNKTPIEWEAAFTDAAGNPIAQAPDWITGFTSAGTGDTDCTVTTDLPEPQFLAMNAHTAALRQKADINSTSGMARYNLSSSTGSAVVENTANSYIINAPGKYSLPLVYGNGVKNGAPNKEAYTSTLRATTTNNKRVLYNFINHLGNAISDPYIYNNTGCEPADAVLVWEGRLNLVRHIALSADKKSIEFEIPASSIRQGNAIVAVRDKNGDIMWSWHLWVTDFTQDSSWITVPNVEGTTTYSLYGCNLGRLYGGDITEFKPSATTVRFTQKNVPEGMTPLTADIVLTQESATISTPDCHPYYQWGRKDPIISALKQYYGSDRRELDGINIASQPFATDHKTQIVNTIKNPAIFYTGEETTLKSITPFYQNLWNIEMATAATTAANPQNVKTIYDPSPVGAKVPLGNVFLALVKYPFSYDEATSSYVVTLPTSDKVYLTTFGYRSHSGGEATIGELGACWSASTTSTHGQGRYMVVHRENGTFNVNNDVVTIGFGLRPVRD